MSFEKHRKHSHIVHNMCFDCKKPISGYATRCKVCCKKGSLNHKYKGTIKRNSCICGNLKDIRAKFCKLCWTKEKQKRMFCIDCGKKKSSSKCLRCKECWKKTKPLTNEKNPHWFGKNVGYAGVHLWVKRRKKKPSFCERCGVKKPYDLANISGEYKRDVNDFEWLCRKCHMNDDGRIHNLRHQEEL